MTQEQMPTLRGGPSSSRRRPSVLGRLRPITQSLARGTCPGPSHTHNLLVHRWSSSEALAMSEGLAQCDLLRLPFKTAITVQQSHAGSSGGHAGLALGAHTCPGSVPGPRSSVPLAVSQNPKPHTHQETLSLFNQLNQDDSFGIWVVREMTPLICIPGPFPPFAAVTLGPAPISSPTLKAPPSVLLLPSGGGAAVQPGGLYPCPTPRENGQGQGVHLPSPCQAPPTAPERPRPPAPTGPAHRPCQAPSLGPVAT